MPMRVIRPLSHALWEHWHLPVAMVTAAIALMAVFVYRAYETSRTDTRLCKVIVQIVSDGDGALDGISYYRTHPVELAQAHARNAEVIRQLDCGHLPSG